MAGPCELFLPQMGKDYWPSVNVSYAVMAEFEPFCY
jgi:hypothetical protein